MGATEDVMERTKVRRRNPARATAEAAPDRKGKHLHLGTRARKMLGVYAIMTEQSETAVVEWMIFTMLKRFVVSDRGGDSPEEPSAVQASEVNLSAPTLPAGEGVTPPETSDGDPATGAGEGPERSSPGGRARRGRS